MPRPKSERHSTDLDVEIARLEQERKRLIHSEDQRRGAIIRELLAGENGGALRALLSREVGARDAFLFGLENSAVAARPSENRRLASSRKERTRLCVRSTHPSRFEYRGIADRSSTRQYFATLGIPLLAGRTFTNNDGQSAPRVAIVDERIARQLWPGEQALGKRLRAGDSVLTVVGVVGHLRTAGVEVDPRPQVYWSVRQWPQVRAVLAVRSELDTRTVFPTVIKAVRSVDPDQSFFDLRTMQDIVDRSLAQRRVTTLLMIGFGAIALLLAAVGIYGVVAYGVTQRFREFGIRVALGATRTEVTRLVVWQGTSMAVVGASVGLVLAAAMAGTMSSLVFGVAPRDALSMVTATSILLIVAALASFLPARRAAAVDPAVTLRSE